MSGEAKIQLSDFEKELVANPEWILTKQSILNKVQLLFGEVLEKYKRILNDRPRVSNILTGVGNGKISRGENYIGLPYVMLDYPAIFNREKIFAIRTMFWWGHFFSVTLHLSGQHIRQMISIPAILDALQGTDFFLCVNDNEWDHSFHDSNYITADTLDAGRLTAISSKKFLKIARKIELDRWNDVPLFLETTFCEILAIIERQMNLLRWPTSPG